MARLQQTVKDENIRFVSFTLDPEHDTPEVMKQYADQFGGDQARWLLLTGDKKALYDVAKGYKLAAVPATGETPILHATKFLLVDAAGKSRGIYESMAPKDTERLARDAHELASVSR
jgi:protein SCO1/2